MTSPGLAHGRVIGWYPRNTSPPGSAVRAAAQSWFSRRDDPDRQSANNRYTPAADGSGPPRRNAGADDEPVTDDLGGRNLRRPAPRQRPAAQPDPQPDPQPEAEGEAGADDDAEWIQRYARVRDLRVEWRDDE